jgi:hypothetical protein
MPHSAATNPTRQFISKRRAMPEMPIKRGIFCCAEPFDARQLMPPRQNFPLYVPRMLRSAPPFAAWCAADPGPSLLAKTVTGVPVLRSSVKNAASRPGHK